MVNNSGMVKPRLIDANALPRHKLGEDIPVTYGYEIDAAPTIDAAPVGWTNIRDRLPNEGQRCFLLWNTPGFLHNGRPHITGGYTMGGKWFDLNGAELDLSEPRTVFAMEIKCWLPLPQIPKEFDFEITD